MALEHLKVHVDDLEPGMYVSELDRPWLDTPFTMQGFFVNDIKDISELKKHCSFVFVDIEKKVKLDFTRHPIPTTPFKKVNDSKIDSDNSARKRTDFFYNVNRNNSSNSRYKDSKSFADELPEAEGVYTESGKAVSQVLFELKDSGKLDVGTLKTSVKPMIDSVLRNRDAMAWLSLMKTKDESVYNRSITSSVWATIFGRHLGFDQESLQTLSLGAMLLDIGKTKIPDELLKKEEALTEKELTLIRTHVELGMQILERTPDVHSNVKQMVHTHHERHNGTGYPQGLKSYDIPVHGRIAAIIDCFDAMTSKRSYAKIMSTYDCLRAFNQLSNVDFQSEMVEQFIQAVGFFPTGTLVELSNGTVGIVVKQNYSLRLRPEVMLILDENKEMYQEFSVISLDDKGQCNQMENSLWITKGLESGSYGIDPSEFFLHQDS
jgi:HD-GYP domain-containing protein (c-di-GMP phosphodiesterase class II)